MAKNISELICYIFIFLFYQAETIYGLMACVTYDPNACI